MRRSEVRVALGLAVVVGITAGTLLYTQRGPIPGASGGPESPGNSASASATPGASVTPDPSSPPPSTPAPSSPESSPSASDSPPPFTDQALLQPENLTDRGWTSAEVADAWDGLSPEQITQCADLTPDDGSIDAHAATIDGEAQGQSITSAEVVARFADEDAAAEVMAELVRRVNACESAPPGESNLTPGSPEHPATDDKVDDAVLWAAEGEDGQVLAVIGLARADDRIALFSLTSFGKDGDEPLDPGDSLDAAELTIYAGRRLV